MIRAGRIFGWVFAVALFVAAGWYALIAERVTVRDEPGFIRGSPEHVLRVFFDWFVSTILQQRIDSVIAIVAFLALIGLALSLRELFGRDRPAAVFGSAALSLGSALWITGNMVQLGGYRAIEIAVEQRRALEPINSIGLVVDMIDDWFELTAFALLGTGIVMFGISALRSRAAARSWSYYSFVVGAVALFVSIAYATDSGDLVDLSLFALGIGLAPGWGVWTARMLTDLDTPSEVA